MKNPKSKYIIIALVIAVLVFGGFYMYRQSKYNKIEPVNTRANYEPPWHWYHTSLPFGLKIVNTADPIYNDSVKLAITSWQDSSVFNPVITKSKQRSVSYSECDSPNMMGSIKFCSFDGPDRLLGFGATYYNADNIILSASIGFNNKMMNGKSGESTPEYRNNLACSLFANILRSTVFDTLDPEPYDSCLQPTYISRVADQQTPQPRDLEKWYRFYKGNIDLPTSSDEILVKNSSGLGTRMEVSADGSMETYELDLGNGYTKKTILFMSPLK